MEDWSKFISLSLTVIILNLSLSLTSSDIVLSYKASVEYQNKNAHKLKVEIDRLIPFNYDISTSNKLVTNKIIGRYTENLITPCFEHVSKLYINGDEITDPAFIQLTKNRFYIIEFDTDTESLYVEEV